MVKHLISYLKPYSKQLILMAIFNILAAGTALGLPYVMGNIVNYGIKQQNLDYIIVQGGIMLGLTLITLAGALVNNKLSAQVMAQFTATMRKRVFDKVNTLTAEQFTSIGTASLITRTTDDIGWLEESIIQLPFVIITCPMLFVGGIIMTAIADWVLALILLAVSPVVLILITLLTKDMGKRWEDADVYVDEQNRIIRERLSGIRVIRAFDKDSAEHSRAEKATRNMTSKFVRNNTISGLISPIASFLLNIATVLILYIGIQRMQHYDWIQAGDMIAVLQYIALMTNSLLMMSWTMAFLPKIRVSTRRIQEVLDMPDVEQDKVEYVKLSGNIAFDNVTFAYPNSQVNALENINLTADNGQIIGVIGGTGSGKTTLLKLLLAFYNDIEGSRMLGDTEYLQVGSKCIRDNIAAALQKAIIFEGTIRDNITMGNANATQQEIERVVSISQLSEFVNSHTEGLEYQLNQSGSNLSGGQKQRINIARAILKNASVYVFDDSFSALDYLTESKLRKSLNKYLDGKTQIIVTQRAATAMRCDKVYVMDKGAIVGCGAHKQLLKSCPLYKEICYSQLGGDLYGKFDE